jgi:hypothetical protein
MAADYKSVPVENRRKSWIAEHWAIAGITALVGACALAGIFIFSIFL